MAVLPIPSTYNSLTNLNLGQVPSGIEDPLVYEELLDIHNALEILLGAADVAGLAHRIVVTTPLDLVSPLRSDVEYFLDGVIDMLGQTIEVPSGGLTIKGYSTTQSKLMSSTANYTMFTSPVGNSGGVTFSDFTIESSGSNSFIFDLTGVLGTEHIFWRNIHFKDCFHLGTITNYDGAQEIDNLRTGLFPKLRLDGTWNEDYVISNCEVRDVDATLTGAIYEEIGTFIMQGNFIAQMNVDLNALGNLFNFVAANFPNPSSLQLSHCNIYRNGVADPSDTTMIPNITAPALSCSWTANQGIANTLEGGVATMSTVVTNVIPSAAFWQSAAGIWAGTDLEHFSLDTRRGRLQHLGESPVEYTLYGELVVSGPINDEVEVRIQYFDNSASTTTVIFNVDRQLNNVVGGKNVAYFNFMFNVTLDIGDFVYPQITDNTAAGNLIVELGSFFKLFKRV
jgi:hypothetical protein